MDQVHKETDKKLKEIEEKVKSVYDTAQKEAKEKLDTYLKQFTDEDKEKQADVQAGDMTWTQYKKWRQDKILTGNRYRAMSEQLTSDYVNADKIAMSIVNGFTPEVYAMNYNYGTYEAESGSMVDTSFTLYDRQTVERLIRDDPDLLPKANVAIPKDKRWNRQKLNSAITQGVLQGDSIPDISKRLQSVTDMDRRAAIRNARTMTTSAENGGRQDSYTRAESMGIKMKKQWMATLDSTTRDSHVMADGQVVGTKDTFHLMHGELEYPGDPAGPPSEVYNCFVGSTIAYANNEILRSYKHWYDGDLIEIKTAGGVSFSVTPNHPILSIDGWVHANALHEGDNILVADFSGDSVSGYPDINHIPARMDAFHKFFNKFGSKRTCSLGVNFHGDVPTSDVEIVTKKWFLLNNRNPGRSKRIDKFLLKFANKSCMSKGPFVKHLWSIAFSTLGNVRSMSKMLSFIFGSMCHTVVHSGRTIPDLDVVISQNSIDNLSAEAILSGKGLDGLAGKVSTDKIVNVKIYSFHGYVYNLQTKDNYYCVNSIMSDNGKYAIAHNCRCTMVAVVDGVDPSIRPDAVSRNSKLGGMTYDEWKEEHQQRADARTARAQKSEQAADTANTIINGKDISAAWKRRPDQFGFEIEDVINAQGFDGKPRVVSAEEFDKAVKVANNGNGFIAQRSYSAPDQETLDAYRDQLYHGKWYVDCSTGGAQYGQGMYCAADYTGVLSDGIKSEMRHYKEIGQSNIPKDLAWQHKMDSLTVNDFNTSISEKELNALKQINGTAQRKFKDMTDDEKNVIISLRNDSKRGDSIIKELDKIEAEVRRSYVIPSYTETLTLDPSAKVITYRELMDIRTGNLSLDYRTDVINDIIKKSNYTDDEATFIRFNLNTGVTWNEVNAAAGRLTNERIQELSEEFSKIGEEATKRYNEEHARRIERAKMLQHKFSDSGSLATALGYDAINAEGHGQSGSYTVILNRTKCIFKGE